MTLSIPLLCYADPVEGNKQLCMVRYRHMAEVIIRLQERTETREAVHGISTLPEPRPEC